MSTAGAASSPRSLLDYLNLAVEFLGSKGIEGARLDAELLLAEALELSRVELYTNYDRPLLTDEVDRFRDLLRRRAAREPVAYILGHREFWSLDLCVDRRVLIPRPETEVLVETALKAVSGELLKQPAARELRVISDRVLDIGTGSGAVAVALAVELPEASVLATDTSAAVLEVAPVNAERHGVSERIEFRHGDLFDAVDDGESFDVIVSNPPYCLESELPGLEPEVREWEPLAALVSGPEGTELAARIIDEAPRYLKPGGWLLIEVGTQAAAVRTLFEHGGWHGLQVFRDLAGHDRVFAAQPPSAAANGSE